MKTRGEYYVSIKVIFYVLLVLSMSVNCQRARADIVFMLLLNVSIFLR
jgi:hypothetical protein